MRPLRRGFTLIELLVVLTIVSVLLSIVVPRYMRQADRAKEAALKENLNTLRGALDYYYSDKGTYPEKLTDLVEGRYLRILPLDPVTERRDSWILITRDEPGGKKVIQDVHSGAPGNSLDGAPFRTW